MALRYASVVCGFELGRLDAEFTAYSGSVSYTTTGARTGTRCLTIGFGSAAYVHWDHNSNGTQDYAPFASYDRCATFALKVASGTRNATATIWTSGDPSGAAWDCSLAIDTSGNLLVRDSAESTIRTITAPFTAGTWYYIHVRYTAGNSGSIEVFIDNVSQGNDTSQDLLDTGSTYTDIQQHSGLCNIASASVPDITFDDYVMWTGCPSADRPDPAKVYYYLSTNASATPDHTPSGGYTGALDENTWDDSWNLPWVTAGTLPIAYTGTGSNWGMNATNDAGGGDNDGGPNGDSTIGSGTILAYMMYQEASRSGGSGTNMQLTYGKVDSTLTTYSYLNYNITDTIPTNPPTIFKRFVDVNTSSTYLPGTSEYCVLGMQKGSGGRDFDIDNVAAAIAWAPSTSTPLTVTCTTETLSLTNTNAKVNARVVQGSTETLQLTNTNATVDATLVRLVQGSTKNLQKYKGLVTAEYYFENSKTLRPDYYDNQYFYNAAHVGAWDGDLDTTYAAGFSIRGWGSRNVINTGNDIVKVEVRIRFSHTNLLDTHIYWNGYYHDAAIAVPNAASSPGSTPTWSPWAEIPAPSAYGGETSAAKQQDRPPYSFEAIREDLAILPRGEFATIRIYAVQIRITESETSAYTYAYYDASTATSFSGAGVVNYLNASDGSTTTWAELTAQNTTDEIVVEGTDLAQGGAPSDIYKVFYRGRWRGTFSGTEIVTGRVSVYDDTNTDYWNATTGTGADVTFDDDPTPPRYFETTGTAVWSVWRELQDIPANKFNWTDISDSVIRINRATAGSAGTNIEISKVELAVITLTPPGQRKGGNVRKTLTVSCTTESLLITESNASVQKGTGVNGATQSLTITTSQSTINAVRSVSGATQALTLTDNDSTVSKVRLAAGATGTLTITESAANVITERHILAATETLTLTDTNATVSTNVPLVINATTETLSITNTNATINAERTVISTTETLTITEQNAVVNAEFAVDALTEPIVLTNTNASVNSSRQVTSFTEALTLTDSDASVTRTHPITAVSESLQLTNTNATVETGGSLVVTCTTESLTLSVSAGVVTKEYIAAAVTEVLQITDSNASINATRSAIGATELLNLTVQSAVANLNKFVAASVEQITLTASPASSSFDKAVVCSTESVTFTDNNSTLNATRGVQAPTESLNIAVSNAQVFRGTDLNVNGATEVLFLTGANANVNRGFSLTASSESLTLTEQNAVITTSVPLVVTGVTETLTLTANNAQVFLGVNLVVTGTTEALTLTESQASINATANVNGVTETLVLTDADATVIRTRAITATTESLNLVVSAATIAITRGIIASSETLLLGVNNATVFLGQNLVVTAVTEQMSLQAQNASVLFDFIIPGFTEVINIATNVATLITSRVVPAFTEILVLTESQGLVYRVIPPSDAPNYIWVVPEPDPHIWVQEVEPMILEGEE